MELGKYLGKGLWGLADKALPVLYGLGYVLLVVRVLPEDEFGTFVLLQEIFLVVTGLATALALNPLLKFAAEEGVDPGGVLTIAFVLKAGFLASAAILLVSLAGPIAAVLNAPVLKELLLYLPLLLLASLPRNVSLTVLQTRFHIREVFWVDAVHFLGAPFLTWVISRLHLFDTALDLVLINIASLSASSLLGGILCRRMIRIAWPIHSAEFRRVWNYGKFSLGGNLSYLIYSKADSFLLSAFTGTGVVALYNAAKIFTRAFEMVTQVVQMFVVPAISRLDSRRETGAIKIVVEKAILFVSVGTLPLFLLFAVGPVPLLGILYQGRYLDAAPILRIFSLLAFAVPAMSVAINTLLGLGDARRTFVLGLQMTGISIAAFLAFIPWLGAPGAALGYVTATFLTTWLSLVALSASVRITPMEILRRTKDITAFINSRLRPR